jgi:hypothetical protein
MKKEPSRSGLLTKHIMAGRFDEADKMIEEGVLLSDSALSNAVFRDNFEAFMYIYPKNNDLGEYNMYSILMSEYMEDKRFIDFLFDEKENNPVIKSFIENPDSFNEKFKTDFYRLSSYIEKNLIKMIPNAKEYSLEIPVSEIKELKSNVTSADKMLKKALGLEGKMNFEPEDKLQYIEWETKIARYREIYDIYMVNRMNYSTGMRELISERQNVYEKMLRIRNEATENNQKDLENKFG